MFRPKVRPSLLSFLLVFIAQTTAVRAAPETASAARPGVHAALFAEVLKVPARSEWQALSRFDGTLTRKEFQRRLDEIFDPGQGLRPYLRFDGDVVSIYQNLAQTETPLIAIRLAAEKSALRPSPSAFRSPDAFRRESLITIPNAPLDGLRIALEPADIGGRWAEMEDRSVAFAGFGRIKEGDLNLIVARLLRDHLTRLGAEVFLVRNSAEPILPIPPDKLLNEAEDFLRHESTLRSELVRGRGVAVPSKSDQQLRFAAGILLTKTLETRARAELVRRSFAPDLTIVLQHNATTDSGEGKIATINRNIFFVHGAYVPAELSDPQKRLRLLTKLLENGTPIEIEVADAISQKFKVATGFPAVLYGNSINTRMVLPNNPYVIARNLGFNREHDGPVVVTEPYFMNQPDTLRRLLLGDYPGERMVAGKSQKSIFREYADCVTEGILQVYRKASEPSEASSKQAAGPTDKQKVPTK